MDELGRLSELHQMEGFWKLYGRLRNNGYKWNHKRVWPIYQVMGLNIKRKAKRRLPPRERSPLSQPDGPNQTWSLDFMSDSLSTGRKFRTFNVLDDFNREALAIEVSTSIPAAYVIRVLEQIIFFRSKPQSVRVDNGPEFISKDFSDWCKSQEIEIIYIQPGKPTQNAYIERFNGSFRRDILDAHWFKSLDEVRERAENWRIDYNMKKTPRRPELYEPDRFCRSYFQ